MSVFVRRATVADAATVAALFRATDLHYWGATAAPLAVVEPLVREHVLGPGSGCDVAIATLDGTAAGYATYGVLYPAPGPGAAMIMKDLFVLAEARSAGVGAALMRFLAADARARGCVRLDWSAETGNPAALAFYDRLGATRLEDKVYYLLDGEKLRRLGDREEDRRDHGKGDGTGNGR